MRQEVNSKQLKSEKLRFLNSEELTLLWVTTRPLIIVRPSTSKGIGKNLFVQNKANKVVHCKLQVHTSLLELAATEISTLQRTIP